MSPRLKSILLGRVWLRALPALLFLATGESRGVAGTIQIRADLPGPRIAPEIYGHFAEHLGRCIYDGLWVGEQDEVPHVDGLRADVLAALKKLNIPVLRWPGGCFADEYHWRDGIGPRDERKKMVNTHWGMVTDTGRFGTHEFLDLCERLGCEAYVAGNVGSGTPEEMQDWVEYMTFAGDSEMANLRRRNGRDKPWRVRYFGVGNENWGCGGNMSPEYYSDLYKRFSTYVRSYPGNRIVKIACGPGGPDAHWLDVVMDRAARRMNAISMHYYVFSGPDWGHKGNATIFDEEDWFALMQNTLEVESVIKRFKEVMDRHDPDGRIGLFADEWGTWWNPQPGRNPGFLYQQNTLRDAVSAALFFHKFHDHCDRIRMANIAQTVNVLQAMILTDGPRMTVTPTYHVFEMFKVNQGATRLPLSLEAEPYVFNGTSIPAVVASAAQTPNGTVNLNLCNLDPNQPRPISCRITGFNPTTASGRVLTAPSMNAHNTFDNPDAVHPVALKSISIADENLSFELPAKSVAVVEIN